MHNIESMDIKHFVYIGGLNDMGGKKSKQNIYEYYQQKYNQNLYLSTKDTHS